MYRSVLAFMIGKMIFDFSKFRYQLDIKVFSGFLEYGCVGLQLGDLNKANSPRIDNTKALWISLSVTRRGHGAVAREYFE